MAAKASTAPTPPDEARLRELGAHLHSLGPRPVAEALLAIARGGAPVLAELEGYARFTPELMRHLGAETMVMPEHKRRWLWGLFAKWRMLQ